MITAFENFGRGRRWGKGFSGLPIIIKLELNLLKESDYYTHILSNALLFLTPPWLLLQYS